MQIAGAVVVVTGAGAGIGRATAQCLTEGGATVVAVDRDADGLDHTIAITGATGVAADVANPTHADRVIDAAVAAHGRVDAVIANAGIGYVGAFATMPVAEIGALLDVNLRAPMLLARAALPRLLDQGTASALVFTTSIAGTLPVPSEAAYCTSKAALESFADSLREELRNSLVAVSTVRPAVVRTAFHSNRNEPYTRRFPRLVPPATIARTIVEVLESGAERRTVPPWLDLATQTRRSLPRLYRTMSRRFG